MPPQAYTGAAQLPRWCFRRRTALLFVVVGLATSHATLSYLGWGNPNRPGAEVVGVLSGLSDLAFAAAGFVVLNRWVRCETQGQFQGRLAFWLSGWGTSYSLYLTHLPLIRLLVVVLPATSLAGGLLRMGFLVPACILFAAGFFWLVERHFLNQPTPARPAAPESGRARLSVDRMNVPLSNPATPLSTGGGRTLRAAPGPVRSGQ